MIRHRDRIVVEVYRFVEAAVELASGLVGSARVELGWVGYQAQAGLEVVGSQSQFGIGVCQAKFDPSPLELDRVAALLDLGAVEHAIGRQVDEALFPLLESAELLGELVVVFAGQRLLLSDGLLDLRGDDGSEVGRHLERSVVVLNCVFDLPRREIREGAGPFLSSPAEEVAVVLSVPPFGFGVDQAAGSSGSVAAVAEQQPFQVVIEHAVTGAAAGSGGHDFLDAVEQLLADDRFVAAGH